MVSAQANQELICEALKAGAVDLLIKPIRHNEVVTMWQHVWKSSCMPQGEPCWPLPSTSSLAACQQQWHWQMWIARYEGAKWHAGGQKEFTGPKRAFTSDTSAVDTRVLSSGLTQVFVPPTCP